MTSWSLQGSDLEGGVSKISRGWSYKGNNLLKTLKGFQVFQAVFGQDRLPLPSLFEVLKTLRNASICCCVWE